MATGHLFRWCCQPRWFVFPASSLMHSTTRLCTMASKQLTCPLFISLQLRMVKSKAASERRSCDRCYNPKRCCHRVGYVGEFARGARHKCLRLAAC